MSMPKLIDIIQKLLTPRGTVTSVHSDYAEVGRWFDDNPTNENRIGYFVSLIRDEQQTGIRMTKATSTSDIRGVTMKDPGYASNASREKFDASTNDLLPAYDYVGFSGFLSVIDNGACTTVEGTLVQRCVANNAGTAVPSTNELGYQILKRIDDSHIMILLESQGDKIQRLKSDIEQINSDIEQTNSAVEQINSDIEQTNSIVALKADQSYVNTQLDTKNPTVITTTISLRGNADWTSSGDHYIQTVSLDSSLSISTDSILIVGPHPTHYQIYSSANIRCVQQSANKLKFEADRIPLATINVQIMILR